MSDAAGTSGTSATAVLQSGVTSTIRVSLSLCIAIILGIFIFIWDGKIIDGYGLPDWLGPFIFLPLLSVFLGYGINCLIQYLSCNKVEWLVQLGRVAIIPLPQWIFWGLLHMIPSIRWPIEGLIQEVSPELQKGFSSGFYAFWIGLYIQSILIGLAQICPV